MDPEGLFIEPAYDLGVVMRSWAPEHPGVSMAEEAMGRCREIQAVTGVEAGAIWKWALIERVSTGLYCRHVGAPGADEMLAVAEEWAAAGEL